jgi:hypothetical protein
MRHQALLFGFWLAGFCLSGCGATSDDDAPAAAGKVGRGGSSGSGGMASMSSSVQSCPDPSVAVDPTAMIDDFEDGDPTVLPIDNRNGAWWTAADDTGGSIVPEQTSLSNQLAAPEQLAEPRCGSHYAMRVSGFGFTDWGALLGVSLKYGTEPDGTDGALPYDVSTRAGVDFWAKIGDTSTNGVRYEISDSNSEPAGGVCVDGGGTGKDCYDSFGTNVLNLDTTWRHYRIPFSQLSQRNFGVQAPALLTTAVYQITFNFLSATDPFDFWVDDISFY